MKKGWLYRRIPAMMCAALLAVSLAVPGQSAQAVPDQETRITQTPAPELTLPAVSGETQTEQTTQTPPAVSEDAQTEQTTQSPPAVSGETQTEQITQMPDSGDGQPGQTADAQPEKAADDSGLSSDMGEEIDEFVDMFIDWAVGTLFPDMDPDEVRRLVSTVFSVITSDEFQTMFAHPEVRALADAVFEQAISLSGSNPELAKKILVTAGAGESMADMLVYLFSHGEIADDFLHEAAETELGQLLIDQLEEWELSDEAEGTPVAASEGDGMQHREDDQDGR